MSSFKDHFSKHADAYAQHRPSYPAELFAFLADIVPDRQQAWDCGTGNGQAALALAAHFDKVLATDASAEQLAHAVSHPRISYQRTSAAECALADDSCDLITVAQAAHWFDLTEFYQQVRRVARDGGVIALWCYGLMSISPELDTLIESFDRDVVGEYWPPERAHIDNAYQSLDFPFEAINAPAFTMRVQWRLRDVLSYLRTWSSVQRYQSAQRHDPVAALASALAAHWPDDVLRDVAWPLSLRIGRIKRISQ